MVVIQMTVFQMVDVVETLDHPHIMGHYDDCRLVLFGDLLQQFHDLFAAPGIQRGGGFIRQDEPGIVGQGPGDGHPLLFAAGEQGREIIGPSLISMYSRSSRTRASAASPFMPTRLNGKSTFWRAVKKGMRLWDWKMKPIFSRRMRRISTPAQPFCWWMVSPSKTILPRVGSKIRLAQSNMVVLPEPLGPRSATKSPPRR